MEVLEIPATASFGKFVILCLGRGLVDYPRTLNNELPVSVAGRLRPCNEPTR